MSTIWQTFYDPDHPQRLAREPSTDSGLDSLEDVEAVMGEPIRRDDRERYLLYSDGVCFSIYRCA